MFRRLTEFEIDFLQVRQWRGGDRLLELRGRNCAAFDRQFQLFLALLVDEVAAAPPVAERILLVGAALRERNVENGRDQKSLGINAHKPLQRQGPLLDDGLVARGPVFRIGDRKEIIP